MSEGERVEIEVKPWPGFWTAFTRDSLDGDPDHFSFGLSPETAAARLRRKLDRQHRRFVKWSSRPAPPDPPIHGGKG